MDGIVEQFIKRVDLIFNDGSRTPVDLEVEERVEGNKTLYTIKFNRNDRTIIGTSEEGFFDAMRKLRLALENDGILLYCFGASEDVYPSGMQVEGGGTSAYRMHLGKQSLSKDIIDIFDSDDLVKPSTVEQQELFRERWIQSLSMTQSTD